MADEATLKFLIVGEDKSGSKALRDVGDQAEKTGGKLDGMGAAGAAAAAAAGAAIVAFGASSVEAFMDAEKSQRTLEDAFERFPALADESVAAQNILSEAGANLYEAQEKAAAAAKKSELAELRLSEVRNNSKASASSLASAEEAARKAKEELGEATDAVAAYTNQQRWAEEELANSGARNVTIEQIRELNAAIQEKTGADADDLAAAQASLAQYGLTGQQIMELTPLLDDYAVKTGKDIPQAAEDLGKAMLGQGKALKSVGIDMEDAGNLGGNFAQVVDGLSTKLGGFAEKEATTAEGALRKLKTEFGDVQEEVGAELLPVLVDLAGALLEVVGWVKENSSTLQTLGIVAGVTAGAIGLLVLQQNIMAAGGVIKFIQAWAAQQVILNAVMNANPISIVIVAIAALVAGLIIAYNTSEDFRNAVDSAFTAVGEAGRWLWNNALAPVIRLIVGGFASVVDGIGDFLLALSNIPGFGWAGDAGRAMKGAAAEARKLAESIRDIPPNWPVRIGVQVAYTATGSRAVGTTLGVANGGKVMFYGSGGREDHSAQFAPGGTWRVWAEDETEGEWYLPLAKSKRDRTIPMWWQAGRDLGVVNFADGGRFGPGSSSGAGSLYGDVHVHVSGNVLAERDLRVAIRDGMAEDLRRRGVDPGPILGV